MTEQRLVTAPLDVCGHRPANLAPAYEPCPKEKGHADDHVYWTQSLKPGASKRAKNGVWVVDEAGEALLHLNVTGPLVPEELAVFLAMRDWVIANPKEPVDPGPGFIPPRGES